MYHSTVDYTNKILFITVRIINSVPLLISDNCRLLVLSPSRVHSCSPMIGKRTLTTHLAKVVFSYRKI